MERFNAILTSLANDNSEGYAMPSVVNVCHRHIVCAAPSASLCSLTVISMIIIVFSDLQRNSI